MKFIFWAALGSLIVGDKKLNDASPNEVIVLDSEVNSRSLAVKTGKPCCKV